MAEVGQFAMKESRRTTGVAVWKHDVIVDLGGLGFKHVWAPGIKAFAQVSAVMDKQFPETLQNIYVIRAPFAFPTLFALVRPFLATSTQKRIQVLGSSYAKMLKEKLGLDVLPADLISRGKLPTSTIPQPLSAKDVDAVLAARTQQTAAADGSAGTGYDSRATRMVLAREASEHGDRQDSPPGTPSSGEQSSPRRHVSVVREAGSGGEGEGEVGEAANIGNNLDERAGDRDRDLVFVTFKGIGGMLTNISLVQPPGSLPGAGVGSFTAQGDTFGFQVHVVL